MFRTFPYVFVFEFRKASQNLDIMNHDARRQLKRNFLHENPRKLREGAGRKWKRILNGVAR